MKNKISLFILLFALLSACGTPVATKPVTVVQRTQTPSPIITPTPSIRPTSTIEDLRLVSSGFPFCQVSPQKAPLGSSVNLSAFHLPPNHPIFVIIYYADSDKSIQLPSSIMTDENGYVNFDILVPADLPTETWNSIQLIPEGPLEGAFCRIWPWTEASLATYSAWEATVRAPTITPPPEQAAMTATQRALHDQLDKYCIHNQAWGFRFSPNGQWVAVSCSWDTMEFVATDETKNWEVSADTLINPGGDYFIGVEHWSNDGAYVYIAFDPHTDGYWEPFHQGIVLYRLDLGTGQISEVLPLRKSDWIFYSLAFSPNDRRLAYIVTDQSPVVLNIRDMQTGEEQSFEFDSKYNSGGRLLWAPDSQSVVFSITQYDTNIHEYIATSIVLCEPKRPACTTLLTDHKEVLIPVEWVNDSFILLQVLAQDEIKFELNRVTGELKPVSP